MARSTDVNNPPVVQQSWDSFVKDFNLILNFGVNALQQKLDAQAKTQGQTERLSDKDVDRLLPGLVEQLDKALDKYLDQVRRLHEQAQMPRGDNRPELTNQNLLGIVSKPARQFEAAPWAEKFDKAADTRIQDAFNEMLDVQADPNAQNKQELLHQFKNKLKMDMSKRLEEKLKYDLAPKMTASIKPKRPGEL